MGLTHKQVILVGDSGCGKSSLALRLAHSFYSETYIPTEFESHKTELEASQTGAKVHLRLQDVTGSREGATFRQLAYEGCDAILLCFDSNNQESYESMETRWVPEISAFAPGVPVFIAACKEDGATQERKESLRNELEGLAEKIGAAGYAACSASLNENVEEIFQQILEIKAQKQRKGVKKVLNSTKKGLKKLYSNM